jgi:hypothetical protein
LEASFSTPEALPSIDSSLARRRDSIANWQQLAVQANFEMSTSVE